MSSQRKGRCSLGSLTPNQSVVKREKSFVDEWLEQQPEPEILLGPLPQSQVIEVPPFDMDPPPVDLNSQSSRTGPSSEGSKLHGTKSPEYRDVLYLHGFEFDPVGLGIPERLQELKRTITATTTNPAAPVLTPAEIRLTLEKLSDLACSDEATTSSTFLSMPLFAKPNEYAISTGSTLPFDRKALPHVVGQAVSTPRPDLQYGYNLHSFSREQGRVMQNKSLAKLAKPTTACYFPYCFFEFKSPSRGGTHYAAENQNAGSGAYCVNALKMLAELASEPNPFPCGAFSCSIDLNYAAFSMHWLRTQDGEPRFVTSHIESFCLKREDHLQSFKKVLANIVEYGNGERLQEIKRLLDKISAFE